MKIGIDCLLINTNRGMGRYIREILKKLNELDKENEYILFCNEDLDLTLNKNFKKILINTKNYFIYEQVILPFLCKKKRIDILWCGGNTFPIFLSRKIKLFVTIHDLIFFLKSSDKQNIYQKLGKIYRRINLILGKNKIHKCFTVSKYSKNEIEKKLNLKKVIITYNNIDNFIKLLENKKSTSILKELEIEKNSYFYTVSGTSSNKNLKMLLNIFKSKEIDKKLVVSGVKNYKKTIFFDFVAKNNLENKIIFTEVINDYEMIDLYKNSKAFIFISLLEGFGIPLIEAQACGCTIIASNTTSLPEVGGKEILYVDPKNCDLILNKIKDVSKSQGENKKQYKNLQNFISWNKTAQIILNEFNMEKNNEDNNNNNSLF